KKNGAEGEARRANQQAPRKHDYKGKGIAYEGAKQEGSSKVGPGRRYREQGRTASRYVRQGGGGASFGCLTQTYVRGIVEWGSEGDIRSKARKVLHFEEPTPPLVEQGNEGDRSAVVVSVQGNDMDLPGLSNRDAATVALGAETTVGDEEMRAIVSPVKQVGHESIQAGGKKVEEEAPNECLDDEKMEDELLAEKGMELVQDIDDQMKDTEMVVAADNDLEG
ncbi:unnamed protein product, partial [Eruca vesicaria subsp. sativa]|nr:unnamed protein product [Eruca vesicaria subsp. sativa]